MAEAGMSSNDREALPVIEDRIAPGQEPSRRFKFFELTPQSENMIVAYELLRSMTSVPVPKTFHATRASSGRSHCVEDLSEGEALDTIWDRLKPEERAHIGKQLGAAVAEWRDELQSPTCTDLLDEGVIRSVGDMNLADPPALRGPYRDDDEVFNALFRAGLDENGVHADDIAFLRRTMPCCEPFVFSGLSLGRANVMVDPGTMDLTCLRGFETAAYLPVWFEWVNTYAWERDEQEHEWREVLRQNMEPFHYALRWFKFWADVQWGSDKLSQSHIDNARMALYYLFNSERGIIPKLEFR